MTTSAALLDYTTLFQLALRENRSARLLELTENMLGFDENNLITYSGGWAKTPIFIHAIEGHHRESLPLTLSSDDQRSTLPVRHHSSVIEDAPAVRCVGVESPGG